MESDQHQAAIQVGRTLASIAMATVVLVAFWLLLGYRYSPESYNSYAITPGSVEFVWIGLALVAAVVTLVLLFPKRDRWPASAMSAIPLAIVSLLILAKSLLHAPLRCYDAILFCTACGWGVVLWIKRSPLVFGPGWSDETKRTRMAAVVVWASVLLLGAYYVWQQIYYWKNLALGYPDCGFETSILYNTVSHPRELFLRISPDHPMVWGHFYPGVLAFVPLWMLWPDFKLIIVLQVVVIVGVAVPLYWIGKQLFKETFAALLLVLAWLAYPSTSQYIYSASYGFRWGNVCVPLYFFALLFWIKGRKGWALAAAIGALSMKEEAAIIIGMFGLYLAVFERRRKLGLTITGVAFGYFLIMVALIIPKLDMGFYPQMDFFDELGQSMWQILLSPLVKPRVFWGNLFEPRSWYFAAVLLAPLLFLPLKKPSLLFVGLLTFVFDCMHPILKSISFHYQAALLPVVFWALAAALQDKEIPLRRAALTGVITSGVMLSLFFGNTFWSKDTIPIRTSPGRLALVQRIGHEIKESNSLFATQRIASHFIKQRSLYVDPLVPVRVDCALLDLQDTWRAISLGWLNHLRALQRRVEQIPGLHLVAAEDGVLLYDRRSPPLDAQHLVERDVLPASVPQQTIQLGCGIRIEGVAVARVRSPRERDSDTVHVTIYSMVVARTNADLAVRCNVQMGGGTAESDSYVSPFKPLGQGIWPIARWETNKFYTDDFYVTLPAGLSAQITGVGFEAAPLSP